MGQKYASLSVDPRDATGDAFKTPSRCHDMHQDTRLLIVSYVARSRAGAGNLTIRTAVSLLREVSDAAFK